MTASPARASRQLQDLIGDRGRIKVNRTPRGLEYRVFCLTGKHGTWATARAEWDAHMLWHEGQHRDDHHTK